MNAVVRSWANWLSSTWLSNWIRPQEWVMPPAQSIHIISVAVVFSCALMISLRIWNVGRSGRTVSQLVKTLLPWMYIALGLLLFTGVVQVIADPTREFVTPAFWWKMFMVVCVVALTIWFGRTVRRNAGTWDDATTHPMSGRVFAVVSMLLWVAIIFCGRFIGYTWNFYA